MRRLWKERQFHDGFDARVIRLRRLLELPAPRGTSRTRTGSTILDDEPLADSKYIRCRLYPPYPKVAAPPCISHTPRALGAVHTAAKCKQKGWNGKRWRMIRLESSKEGKQEGGNAKHRPVGHDSIISTGRRGRRAAATERAPARTEAHAANQAPYRRFEHDGIKSRAGRARGGGGARPRGTARQRSDHGSANGTARREHKDRESTRTARSRLHAGRLGRRPLYWMGTPSSRMWRYRLAAR